MDELGPNCDNQGGTPIAGEVCGFECGDGAFVLDLYINAHNYTLSPPTYITLNYTYPYLYVIDFISFLHM
jgi:hypothetical protein